MASFNMISDLKPYKTMWKIKVKIIRLWTQCSKGIGLTLEMVVVDSNGDKIHVIVKKDLVKKFEPILIEGGTNIFTNFSVGPSSGGFRTTKHQYKITFISATRVKACEEDPIRISGLQPVNFKSVLSGALNPDYLVDVIGQIVEASNLEVLSVNGKDTQKISIELRNDEDDRLPLVLWGNYAQDVSDAINLRGHNAVICVLRFGKIKTWKGQHSISNAYNVSTLSLNPEIAEVEAFCSLLPPDDLSLQIVETTPRSLVSKVSAKDDFFKHTPRKSIADIIESTQAESCIVMCTIASIDDDMGWYYLSCSVCSKKVIQVTNDDEHSGEDDCQIELSFYCEKCKISNPKIIPRYKLHLGVQDNTGNVKFLLFDSLAVQILHQPCIELAGSNVNEIVEPNVVPLAIKNCVGKTFLFKIAIERENYVYKHDTYKVLSVITNPDMITDFGSQIESTSIDTPDPSLLSDAPEGSLSLNSGDSSNFVLTSIETPLKRAGAPIVNLEESFDQNSQTKSPCLIKVKKEKIDKSI